MLDFLYKLITPWAISSTSQIFKNKLIGRLANYIYPVYCRIVPIKRNTKENIEGPRTIISLTSFPARIGSIHLCLNSLLRQKRPADLVILWLARSQFPNACDIPSKVRKLEKRGLQIRFCEDIRSYKKIVYTAIEYPDSVIITADDDTLYPESWTEGLMRTYMEHRDCVCCYRAHKLVVENGDIAEYKKWIGLSPNEKGPSSELVPIGVGGVLYPPGFFKDVKFDIDSIKDICPTADDLWLKVLGLSNDYKVVKVNSNSKEWFTILNSQRKRLVDENVDTGANDTSIKRLMEYYKISVGKIKREG